jgi:hypothetical protein
MTGTVAKSHGRVEHARQQLVNAEEKYLTAHGWVRQVYGGQWLWVRQFPYSVDKARELLVMERSEAVQFQHISLGDGE